MTRILAVDDEDIKETIFAPLETQLPKLLDDTVEPTWIDPAKFDNAEELQRAIGERSREPWDAFIVDIHLLSDEKDLSDFMLPVELVKSFRQNNNTALVLMYSGNIEEYVRQILSASEARKSKDVERHLRSIIGLSILGFSARGKIVDDLINALQNPPLLLRLDKEMQKTPNAVFKTGNKDIEGKTFSQLGDSIRMQNRAGQEVSRLVLEVGIAGLVDLCA
jgi:hypothetical protein